MKLRGSWTTVASPADRSLGMKSIIWTNFIEVSEVDADPPLAILLPHMDEIGEPIRVECLLDEADL